MKRAIACAHLCTCRKRLRHAFFCLSKTDMNLSRQVVFCTPRRPANILELSIPKWVFFWEVSQNFYCKYFFEMLMDEYSKNSNNIFSTAPMVPSEWMKKRS